ncbi:ComEC/Rec2 family competence protein [Brytella acorum]|uniref:ComEC/Rec2 family competence protein n=1 Tax=Brytella acorum TaxID=2959299 RepID=A0AA35Y4G3_9PROT|nr:ComEC/Rec2 family competence protein [Brytella acorum]MDF3625021.1 ComEC/Rec2 family competence protein [Brytella acorum]CAI9121100.1 ComEC/Rec2 family competence protein [Brytella acorum]
MNGAFRFDPDEPDVLTPETTARMVLPSRIGTMVQEQGRRLPSWLPVFFGVGAIAYFLPRHEPGFLCPAVVFCGALVIVATLWRRPLARLGGFALLIASAGFLDVQLCAHRQPDMPYLPSRAVILSGEVARIDAVAETNGQANRRVVLKRVVFESGLDIGMSPLRRTLRISLKARDPAVFLPGARLRMRALLRLTPWPSSPGGRDMQREAWFAGQAGTGTVLGTVSVLSGGRTPLLEHTREAIAASLMTWLPDQRGAIAATLLAGETASLSTQTRDDFAVSGLAHLLAVAGLHLGLVMGFVVMALRLLMAACPPVALRWPCREIAVIVGFVAGGLYVLLTGSHLPAVRALGMAAFGTVALLAGRRVLSMRALALVALGIMAFAPYVVLDVSFQMSFAAVMALIAAYDVMRGGLLNLRGEGGVLRGAGTHGVALVLTSVVAGLATLPVSLAHFGLFQPWFVLANLLAVPLAGLWVMPAGIIALLLMPLGLARLPVHVMGAGIALIMRMAHGVAGFPVAVTPVPAMPGWGLLLYLLGLCFLCLWRGKARLCGLLPILFAMASPWLVARPDVLVAPDAGSMAVRVDEGLAVGMGSGLDRLVVRDWTQALALPTVDLADVGTCDGSFCRVKTAGGVVLMRPQDRSDGFDVPPEAFCREASLFVTQSPAREACPGLPFIDRFSVWRDGAFAAYAGPHGWKLVSDRAWRGDRFWVPAPGSRGVPNLPMAQAE